MTTGGDSVTGGVPAQLSLEEFNRLARYNAEVARGIVHTDEWKASMAELQHRFNTAGYTPKPKNRRKLIAERLA